METWKMLLITLLSAVVLGCIAGVVVGKHQVKKANGQARALLTGKERLIYSLCILLGAACILFGLLVAPGLMDPGGEGDIIFDENGNPVAPDNMPGGEMMPGADSGVAAYGEAAAADGKGEETGPDGGDAPAEGEESEAGDGGDAGAQDGEDEAEAETEEGGDAVDEESADVQANAGGTAPAAPAGRGGSVRVRGGGGGVVVYEEAIRVG